MTGPTRGAGLRSTHCPYCALNCGMQLETSEGRISRMVRWKDSPLTKGALCSKGSTAHLQVDHQDRLTTPLIRRDGALTPVGWDEAIEAAAAGFRRIKDSCGPDANAVLSGGSLTNEKVYLVGKLARLALRTPHVDYNGRFCMVSAGKANMMAFGRDRATTPLSELADAEVIIVVGANLSDAYPVVIPQAIDRARRKGATVVVIDPRMGRWVKSADMQIRLRPGTDGALFQGLLRQLVKGDLVNKDFVARRTTGFDVAVASAERWTPDEVEAATDVASQTVVDLAELIGSTSRCMLIHARGAEQQLDGTNNVLAMINVMLACGHIGRPASGINMLTGQRNGQGGREWGQRCDQLPAGRSIANPEHRNSVAEHWGIEPDRLPGVGKTYVEILQAVETGAVQGLLSLSNNMLVSAPNLSRVRSQLSGLQHLVVIDPFPSEVLDYAHVVLPGTTFAEEEGTVTTIEGRVVRCEQITEPVSGPNEIEVLCRLGASLGANESFPFDRGRQVWEEMRLLSAGGPNDYSGITWDRTADGLAWPCPSPDHPGTPRLYEQRFAHDDGLARFHPIQPPIDRQICDEFPLAMTNGRHLAHYLSRNQTKRIAAQDSKAPEPYVEIHPETAEKLGIGQGQAVSITSATGRSTVNWRANDRLRPDTVFMLYHWPECNELVADDLDPVSKMPGFKHTPVRLGPVLDLISSGQMAEQSKEKAPL